MTQSVIFHFAFAKFLQYKVRHANAAGRSVMQMHFVRGLCISVICARKGILPDYLYV